MAKIRRGFVVSILFTVFRGQGHRALTPEHSAATVLDIGRRLLAVR
ncbi:MAG: hypothetical protein ABSG62_15855 [Terracidiphilus sp.]|jgi:hypothetical protein